MAEEKQEKIGKKTSLLIIAIEVLAFVILVMFLALRKTHYFRLAGPKPHMAIFLVDSLRADHMSCYGYRPATSPYIEKLAGRGVLFESARSQAPWTKPSVASLFTSLYVSEHHVVSPRYDHYELGIDSYGVLRDEMTTLAEALRDEGYYTAAFSTNTYIDPVFNYQQGFDVFVNVAGFSAQQGRDVKILDLPANYVNDDVISFIEEYRASNRVKFLEALHIYMKPLFIYVHYMDVHYPYYPPPPFTSMFDGYFLKQPPVILTDEQLDSMKFKYADINNLNFYISRYDAQIRFFDSEFEKLVERIDGEGLLSPGVKVLTADHGEAFNEHGNFNHGGVPYEEVIHIPLIFWGGDFGGGKRIPDQVDLIDVGPTLLDIAGIDIPEQFSGVSLAGYGKGGGAPARTHWSENYSMGKPFIAMLDGDRKWFFGVRENAVSEIYDIRKDPAEQDNLIGEVGPDLRAEQSESIEKWVRSKRDKIKIKGEITEPNLPPEVEERLRALGYL